MFLMKRNHAQGFKLLTSTDASTTKKDHTFLFGDMVGYYGDSTGNFPTEQGRWQLSFRDAQATVLPLERKGSAIEMQPVIFTIQKTQPAILPSERNGQRFSPRELRTPTDRQCWPPSS